MSYDLHHHMSVYVKLFRSLECVTELIRKTNWVEGSTPVDYWIDTADYLYVIANTFNLCVVLIARFGSTTVLPFYSNMDCTAGMLFIGFTAERSISYRYFFLFLFTVSATPYSYSCEMDALCLQCRCNGNIIEMYELVDGQTLIITGL
ncbi:hypothetical protein M9H77_08772 [Catharanthus roseus]|uniref:Uncharacterized protein n=1 Tax=Catharanthus roseus TaxID=4058 RepID=A0ACC0BYX0_CATRO|nr:hypothetical protein M9H77_08772 [Catharanthus roseus]